MCHHRDKEKILSRQRRRQRGKTDSTEAKVNSLEILIDLINVNKQLKKELARTEKQLDNMQSTLNKVRLHYMDQHHRSRSARVLNVSLTTDEEQDPNAL